MLLVNFCLFYTFYDLSFVQQFVILFWKVPYKYNFTYYLFILFITLNTLLLLGYFLELI